MILEDQPKTASVRPAFGSEMVRTITVTSHLVRPRLGCSLRHWENPWSQFGSMSREGLDGRVAPASLRKRVAAVSGLNPQKSHMG